MIQSKFSWMAVVLVSCMLLGSISISKAQPEQPDKPAQSGPSSEPGQLQPIPSRVGYLNGVWEGSYMCRQGLTRLRLVIQAKSTTEIGIEKSTTGINRLRQLRPTT